MPIDTALNPAAALPREIPHAVSPGLWTLAWRRLKTDSVAMVSLAIVAAFILLMIVSGFGLVAKDWAKEVGINYAPPSWITLGATDAPPPVLPGGAAEPNVPAGPWRLYAKASGLRIGDLVTIPAGAKALDAGVLTLPGGKP